MIHNNVTNSGVLKAGGGNLYTTKLTIGGSGPSNIASGSGYILFTESTNGEKMSSDQKLMRLYRIHLVRKTDNAVVKNGLFGDFRVVAETTENARQQAVYEMGVAKIGFGDYHIVVEDIGFFVVERG